MVMAGWMDTMRAHLARQRRAPPRRHRRERCVVESAHAGSHEAF
eukprot:COSAG01_NODE_1416_length_10373_cov_4.944984_13_plen_43_part_01